MTLYFHIISKSLSNNEPIIWQMFIVDKKNQLDVTFLYSLFLF